MEYRTVKVITFEPYSVLYTTYSTRQAALEAYEQVNRESNKFAVITLTK